MTCLTEICTSVVLLAMVSISTAAPYTQLGDRYAYNSLSEVIAKTRALHHKPNAGYGYRKIENRHVDHPYEDRASKNSNFYSNFYNGAYREAYSYPYTTYGAKLSRKTATYDPSVYESRYTTYGRVSDNRSGFPLVGNSQDRSEMPVAILNERVYPTHYCTVAECTSNPLLAKPELQIFHTGMVLFIIQRLLKALIETSTNLL